MDPMKSPTIDCPACKQGIAIDEFIAGCSHYWKSLDVVQFKCPRCHKDTEACIETDRVSLGYTYAAGSPHFCGMIEVEVDGLEASHVGESLTVQFAGNEWTITSGK
jgi:hypothetical protein